MLLGFRSTSRDARKRTLLVRTKIRLVNFVSQATSCSNRGISMMHSTNTMRWLFLFSTVLRMSCSDYSYSVIIVCCPVWVYFLYIVLQCIRNASWTDGGDQLALGFSNRSAVFYHLKQFSVSATSPISQECRLRIEDRRVLDFKITLTGW